MTTGFEIVTFVAGTGLFVAPLALTVQEIIRGSPATTRLVLAACLSFALLSLFIVGASHLVVRWDWYRLRWLFNPPPGGWPPYPRDDVRPAEALLKSIVYLVVLLSVGMIVVVALSGIVLFSIACIAAPVIVIGLNDWINIGPVRVDTPLQATACLGVGLAGIAGAVGAAWPLARLQSRVVLSLTPSQNDFRRKLVEAQAAGSRILEAFDAERQRIERDLHDGIQPALVRLRMSLGLMRMRQMTPEELDSELRDAQNVAKDLLAQTRDLIRGTFPQALLGDGLLAALSDFADGFCVPMFVRSATHQALPSHLESTLYFCVAELATNAAKHATSEQITVTIYDDRRRVWIEVVDDGHGGAESSGRGLTGVAERLRLVGGELMIDSPPGGPTVAVVTVPRKERHG
ncbi:histidine kinase [Kocuria carniphila]|uniref:histidine kinase n=1 Tax=Kocuria carniphila TaxID=262208 RepID=A0ABV3V976_9MICC